MKTSTVNQNPPDFKELKLLEQQTKRQYKHNDLSAGVGTNIVIIIVIVFGANGPLVWKSLCVCVCFLT